jgi:beta-lactam-binding protein with PASTA domain
MKLVKSIIVIGVIFVFLLIITFKYLDYYTNKDKAILVPDLIGKKLNEVSSLVGTDLQFVVSDSLYDKKKERGLILNQNPKPNALVKPGRTIYLTLNKNLPVLVIVPELTDESLNRAKENLISAGFEVGRIDTVEFEVPIILEASYEGQKIAKGETLLEGTRIDLKVGKGNLDDSQ